MTTKIKRKLAELHDFISDPDNREYCLSLQRANIDIHFVLNKDKNEAIYNVLVQVFNSQSQPRLDKAFEFFSKLYQNRHVLESFKSFSNYVTGVNHSDTPWKDLFIGLKKKEGWGDKTSALFIRDVYNYHFAPGSSMYKFWKDIGVRSDSDELMLPVDRVIKDIFRHIDPKCQSFKSINDCLKNEDWNDMEVWDDLWFWGYINQRGKGAKRRLNFNKAKLWMLPYAPKEPEMISDIERRSKIFRSILIS